MEAIIITSDQFQELISMVNQIHQRVEKLSVSPHEAFIDNSEFIQIMKISKRTAQTWRDEKRVAFSQVGAKIYYRLSDVSHLLSKNYYKANPLEGGSK